jgi:hypothetical protein
MEDFKLFITTHLQKLAKMSLVVAILVAVTASVFWAWFFGFEGSIVMPRLVLIIFIFAPIIVPVLLYVAFVNSKPTKTEIYKLLFDNPEKIVGYSLKPVGNNLNVSILRNDKKQPLTIGFNRADAQSFLGYLKQYLPEVKEV